MTGAEKIVNAMKKVGKSEQSVPSQIVTLTIKSTSPLIFSLENRLDIDSNFYVLSKFDMWNDPTKIHVGDVVRAMSFNEGQKYFIMDRAPFNQEYDFDQMTNDIEYLKEIVDPGGGGTISYNRLNDKPQINDVTLEGNKSLEDLNIYGLTNVEIYEIMHRLDAINS